MNSEVKKISKTKDRVIHLLTKFPEYRDNDERLIATFWAKEITQTGRTPESMTSYMFLKYYSEGKFTSADCIVRSRALIQQQMPELRGEKWNQRHGLGEEVRKEIHEI